MERNARRLAVVFVLALPALALAGDPIEAERLCTEGEVYFKKGEFEKAAESYKKATEADPTYLKGQFNLGACYGTLMRCEEAIAQLEKVKKLETPRGYWTASALCELGVVYGIQNEWEKALASASESVKIKDDDARAWHILSVCFSKVGKVQDAIDAGERSLKLDPNQPEVVAGLEQLRKTKGEQRERPDPAAHKAKFEISVGIPSLGGWAVSPDMKTLYASNPSRAELLVLDTTGNAEPKRIALEFQPGRLALQGKVLFAAANGAAKLSALDTDTLKVQKTIKLPAVPLVELACHRARGLLYGVGTSGEVFSIDASTGKVTKTAAKGSFIAVDPFKAASAGVVYLAGPGEKDASKTALRKYTVAGADLKLVETNEYAAIKGSSLVLSPDGKRIFVIGEPGWRGPDDPKDANPNAIAFFETDSIKTGAGRLETVGRPIFAAFHPFLDFVVVGTDQGVEVFRSRSLAAVKERTGPFYFPASSGLAFVGGATRMAMWLPGDAAKKEDGTLGVVPMALTDEDKAAIEKGLASLDKPR